MIHFPNSGEMLVVKEAPHEWRKADSALRGLTLCSEDVLYCCSSLFGSLHLVYKTIIFSSVQLAKKKKKEKKILLSAPPLLVRDGKFSLTRFKWECVWHILCNKSNKNKNHLLEAVSQVVLNVILCQEQLQSAHMNTCYVT